MKNPYMPNQLPITTYGMQILRSKTKPVKEITPAFINLVEDMFYSMDKASGIGLAAPQVNLNISLTVIDIRGIEEYKKVKPLVLINPEILESHGEIEMEEGCLSIPDIRENVTRPKEIFLKFNDFDMKEVKMELDGFIARVAQHEIDHLNGKLFIDYLSEQKKKELKKSLNLIKKGKVKAAYPLQIHTGEDILKTRL